MLQNVEPLPQDDASVVSTRPLRQRIRDELARRIISGYYRDGERLVEMRIAEMFGTSQTPVREALRDLDVTGLVDSRPRRGTFVASEILASIRDIFLVRASIEEAAARAAAQLLEGQVDDLQAEVDAMVAAAMADDTVGAVEHSIAFHRKVLEAAGNKLLLKIWLSLQVDIHTAVTMFSEKVDGVAAARSHQPIVDAIADGDVELAGSLSREHQEDFAEVIGTRS